MQSMKKRSNIPFCLLAALWLLVGLPACAAGGGEAGEVDPKEIIFGHIEDEYEWHITTWGVTHISIPLPVILYSQASGWHLFSSSRFHHGKDSYNGFYIAGEESAWPGKIVERDARGKETRPVDLSITKIALSIMINSMLLVFLILYVSRWYRRHNQKEEAPKGLVGLMEMFIMMIVDDVIKPCIGHTYQKFTPYLLTAFFFIFLNNLMGLVPFFPGGANVTGNIAVTLVLALCTFIAINLYGTKGYWKEIFWPDVPWWMKAPVPMMPFIEFFGIFTKPFALMVRLFANILAGHMIILVLGSLIFITVSMGPAINAPMTFASVLFSIFMNLLELLVAFIQAYVFTLLSAVFIGMAQAEHH